MARRPGSVLASLSLASLCLASLLLTAACASAPPQRVSYASLDSEAEARTMAYSVYTPPGWGGETELPLVVFLHGGGDDETVLARHAVVVETFDEWIREGRLPGLLKANRRFHEHLVAHGVPHHYLEYRGGHGWRSWAQLFPVALCLHMRGGACELEPATFYSLERAGDGARQLGA